MTEVSIAHRVDEWIVAQTGHGQPVDHHEQLRTVHVRVDKVLVQMVQVQGKPTNCERNENEH